MEMNRWAAFYEYVHPPPPPPPSTTTQLFLCYVVLNCSCYFHWVQDPDDVSGFGNLSLQLDISEGMINPEESDDDPSMSLGGALDATSLADCESIMEVSAMGIVANDTPTTTADNTPARPGRPPLAPNSKKTLANNKVTKKGLTDKDWADAQEASYEKFVQSAIVALENIKNGKKFNSDDHRSVGSKHGDESKIQSFADNLFAEALDLENDLLTTAKGGSFKKVYESLKQQNTTANVSRLCSSPHLTSPHLISSPRSTFSVKIITNSNHCFCVATVGCHCQPTPTLWIGRVCCIITQKTFSSGA